LEIRRNHRSVQGLLQHGRDTRGIQGCSAAINVTA